MNLYPPIPGFFDSATALALALSSRAAYGSAEEIQAWVAAQASFDRCHVITEPSTDTQLFIAADSENIIASFRGTQDLRNWMTDVDCRLKMGVHRGFDEALESVWEEFRGALDHFADNRQKIVFTGHSLGGALAMLAAWRMCDPVHAVYTFGQPRVGNRSFAAAYDSVFGDRTFRVIHAQDIVPRVPWLLNFYRHSGHEVFFPSFSILHSAFCIDLPWYRKIPSDVVGAWSEYRAAGRIALLADHHVDTYVKLLRACSAGFSPSSAPPQNPQAKACTTYP